MKKQSLFTMVIVSALGLPSLAPADVVTDWNNAALAAIRGYRTPPPVASRALAMLHVSIYDAVNGISRTHSPYYVDSAVPAGTSKEAAASAAARKVLVALFPTNAPAFNALHAATLAGVENRQHKNKGIAWGEHVATRILALRANDGSDAVVAAPGGSGPGAWIPTPPAFAPYLLPQWGFVMPFTLSTRTQFRPDGPPALTSSNWAADYIEVKAMGAAVGSVRTAEQTQIALFWADGAGTETPPGHWNSIGQDVATAQGNTLEQNARMFALLNLAMADAAISCWDCKYTFSFWRPVTAIRAGDTDDNEATQPDPGWSSLIPTPPFPDYSSGHSTFSGAAATVLAMFYGTDDVSFTTDSDSLPGTKRSFASFSEAASEAAVSRIYGGIHYRSANEHGLESGMRIGEWTATHYLKGKGNRSRK